MTKTEGKKLAYSREAISIRSLEIMEQLNKTKSYRDAVKSIGRMVALSKCIHDEYWKENLLMVIRKKLIF